jgi:hypothetical protein
MSTLFRCFGIHFCIYEFRTAWPSLSLYCRLGTKTTCTKRTRWVRRASKEGKEDAIMSGKETVEAAKRDLAEGKSPSTAAGEFVHEEIDHVRERKHGVRSAKQAIAIGLSKARRAGIPLGAPNPRNTSAEARRKAAQDSRRGEEHPVTSEEVSTKRGKARMKAMKREPKSSVSHAALSRQAKSTARKRGQTVHRKSR